MTMVKSLSFFIATTIFLVSVALAIPVVFSDSEPIKGYLLQKVGDAIGGHVTTEHLELQLFASPKVRLNQLVVKNQEDGRRLLQLEDGDCELEFLALVIGQVVINHCTLNGLAITLRREQDGSWSWLIFPAAEEDSGTSLVTFAGLKKLGVNNSHITLVDETDPRNPRSIVLSHLEAMMAVKVESRQIDFEASAVPVDTESPATLAIAGHIQAQLHAQTFSVQQASAKIEAINVELRSLLEFIQPGMVFAAKTPIGNLQAALSLFPDQAGYTLVAEEFSASIGALNIRGKTSITGLSSQQPAFIFTATAPAFKVKTLTQLIPSKWLPEDVQRVLSTYQHGGTIEVEHITVSGPLTDDADFSVIGKFLMSNGWIKLNSSSSRLRNIQGSVVLNHDHLTLHDVALEYDSSKILNAFGRIEFREPHPSLTLTINANILADDVLKTARQYHAGTPYLPVWLDLQHVEGDADLRLTIEGLLTSPKKLKAHHGELAIRNLGFRPTTYPLSIQALSGHIRFDQDHLTMDGFSAEYESSKILRASGRIEFREPQPMLTMTASATILAKDALKTVRQLDAIKQNPPSWLDLQSVEGDAAVTLMIEGPLAELGELKIQQGELRVRNLGFQPSGFPLAVRTLFGTIGFDQDHAVIQELRGRVGKSRATLLGSVFYGEHHALKDLTLRSQVELSDFKQLFPKLSEAGGLSGGPLGMAMKISGSVKQRIIHMGIDFTPLHVSYPAVFQKPSGIPMQLKFDGMFKSNQILTIHQTSLEMPPFHLNMKGELSVDDPRIFDVTLTTGSDKNTFFPTGVVVGSEQLGIRQLEANLRIKGTGEDWSAWQTSGILHVNKQEYDCNPDSEGHTKDSQDSMEPGKQSRKTRVSHSGPASRGRYS